MAETKTYYSCSPYEERFTHTDLDEAVDEYLSYWDSPLPPTVKVQRYEPKKLTDEEMVSWADELLERLIEQVDEEYGDPEEATKHKPHWKPLMCAAVRDILHDYYVWMCEEVKPPIEVNTAVWIRQHNPQWLEDKQLLAEVERLEAGDKSPGGHDG